jgi:hypothetical protein
MAQRVGQSAYRTIATENRLSECSGTPSLLCGQGLAGGPLLLGARLYLTLLMRVPHFSRCLREVGLSMFIRHPLLAGGGELFCAPVAERGIAGDYSIRGDTCDVRGISVRSFDILEPSIGVKKTDVGIESLEGPDDNIGIADSDELSISGITSGVIYLSPAAAMVQESMLAV